MDRCNRFNDTLYELSVAHSREYHRLYKVFRIVRIQFGHVSSRVFAPIWTHRAGHIHRFRFSVESIPQSEKTRNERESFRVENFALKNAALSFFGWVNNGRNNFSIFLATVANIFLTPDGSNRNKFPPLFQFPISSPIRTENLPFARCDIYN